MKLFFIFLLTFLSAINAEPIHIRLSLGNEPNQYLFTWEDFDTDYQISSVLIKGHNYQGFSYLFDDSGEMSPPIRVHRVFVNNLKPNQQYEYQVGNSFSGFSKKYTFKTPSDNYPLRVSIYGDLGLDNHRILKALSQTESDLVIHAGDFAYNLEYQKGNYANKFFDLLSKDTTLTSENIFQTCAGNHESHNNFSYYKSRIATEFMHPMYYSFNLGKTHFVSINSEYYFYGNEEEQVKHRIWLEKDLANVNRSQTPWIIVFGHRQMYASGRQSRVKESEILRNGLEDLFGKYEIDMYICGHQHNYERMYPIFNKTYEIVNQPNIYRSPRFPIHVVNGAAGGPELLEKFDYGIMPYSLVRKAEYSFGLITIYNATHLLWEQIDEERNIIDSFKIIK